MSKYTMCFYDLDKEMNKDFIKTSVDERLDKIREFLFDFRYPIDDPITRERVEKAILKHYYMREIAFETWGLFKIKLDDRLNLIGRRYNELYKHYEKEIDPFINSYLQEKTKTTSEVDSIGEDSTTMNEESDKFNSQSDTPQGILQELKEGRYSSYATIDTDTRNVQDSRSSQNNTESKTDYEREIKSLQGLTQAEAFRNFFDNVISLDEEIVNEMSDLFLVIW